MEKLIYFFIGVIIFANLGFTIQSLNTYPKVLEVFSQTFKNPRNLKWVSNGDESTAIFIDNDIKTAITYDNNANLILSRRYYGENNLPFNILLKIKEKYKGKIIGTVAEVIQEGFITYSINLDDKEHGYVIESDGNANMRLKLKFKKQQG